MCLKRRSAIRLQPITIATFAISSSTAMLAPSGQFSVPRNSS